MKIALGHDSRRAFSVERARNEAWQRRRRRAHREERCGAREESRGEHDEEGVSEKERKSMRRRERGGGETTEKTGSGQTGRPTAGDPGHSPRFYKQPNTVHPPSARFTIPYCAASMLLFSVAPLPSGAPFAPRREAPRRLEDSDKRGQLTGVFGMHGASWGERERGRRRGRKTSRRRETRDRL